MSDNTTLNSMTGGDVIASDDIGGVKFQRVKVAHGTDGSATDTSDTAPFPIDLTHASTTTELTTATLANGVAYTSAWFDSSHAGKTFTLIAVSDTAGKIEHEESLDGSTVAWYHETPYMAGEYYRVDHASFGRYSRFRFTNNSGAGQTSFKFSIMQCVFPQTQVMQNAYDIDTTQTPLGISATYTSKSFNTKTGGPAMTFLAVSDQAGTLYLDESVDGVTWDTSASAAYPGGGYVFNEMHTAHANFFRVRMTNGGVAQTYLRLQMIQRFMGIPWMIKLDPNQAAVTQGADVPWQVEGNITNNASDPAANNLGVLSAIANAAVPTRTEGKVGALRTTLTGDLAVTLDSEAIVAAGAVAHDTTDSGNPLKIGGRADSAFQPAVVDGDRVDALFDVYGVQRVRNDQPNRWSYHENSSSALTDAAVQAAPGAGLSVYITDIVFSTGAATAINIFLEEGTTTILGPYYLEGVAGRGMCIHFNTPHKCTANTAAIVTTSAAIAHGLDIKGFIAP